jgi:N-acetylneuraminate synthase
MKKKTLIIAEAGVNHNGSIELAKQLVDAAVEAGADIIKFQTFRARHLVTKNAPKAEYQKRLTEGSESQFEMLKSLELSAEQHHEIVSYCNQKGIEFLSTPFDIESAQFLINDIKLPFIKISSGDLTNSLLLLKVAKAKKPVILSTGMATLSEIEYALSVLAFGYINEGDVPNSVNFEKAYASEKGQQALRENVTLLQCTTEYPAPFNEINLNAMKTLHTAFGLPVGFSDHSKGIEVPIAAVALGATVIEKHFTLDKTLPGPDHQASLEPDELATMIKAIRNVEKALGTTRITTTLSELKNKYIARKSIVACRPIKAGERFSEENITVKRPGNGISAAFYWDWIGKVAEKDYEEDDLI